MKKQYTAAEMLIINVPLSDIIATSVGLYPDTEATVNRMPGYDATGFDAPGLDLPEMNQRMF